jgi:hypothetical protein
MNTPVEVPELWRTQLLAACEVPGQGLCAVERFLVTVGYRARYCYDRRDELVALVALALVGRAG